MTNVGLPDITSEMATPVLNLKSICRNSTPDAELLLNYFVGSADP
jgi:hypothetical protein